MAKTYTFRDKGTSISFTEGEHYYMSDYFPLEKRGKYLHLPVVIKLKCIPVDSEEELVEFYLKKVEHLIPSDLPLGSFDHPSEYITDEWDNLFHKTSEEAFNQLEKEYRENKSSFFMEIFEGTKR